MVALACLAWVAAGVYGVVAYGHNYYTFRGFSPPVDPPGVRHGTLLKEHFYSPSMHQRRSYLIYQPPGYAAAVAHGRRFPVLYLLHGSPGGGSLFIDAAGVGVALDRLVAAHRVRPFLIVMPGGSDGTFRSDTEWADTPHGRYESLALDAVRAVDARWPTIPDRRHRGLAGDSEGAYAAVNIGLRHLDDFSVAESWSGYFIQKARGPFAGVPRAIVAANSPLLYVRALKPRLRLLPFHAFIYTGRRERAAPGSRDFSKRLRQAGGDARFELFRGGHNWRLWRAEAPLMLDYAARWFNAP
ncbi:MAG: alpha/beta hydrolase family protein [Thermoleophilaceae bacterium]